MTVADEHAPVIPDLVGRLFDPDRLDHTWVGDITYIPTGEGWLYLPTVIDLASRRLLGWSMGNHHDTTLVSDALTAAVAARGRSTMQGTTFHSDRGSEYTSGDFRRLCRDLGLAQSTGRTRSCLENAVAESFFATLKVELVHRVHFATRGDARQAIFSWIARYKYRRLHSANGMVPPIEWEESTIRQQPAGSLPSTTAA